jgi:Fe-S cluster assembly scaffold protein SufB
LVATNDVQASHACKMEKISDESLFYLRSRGIERENALLMMIESKIMNLYRSLTSSAPELYEKIIQELLTKIH